VIADIMRGTGRYNLAQGAIATMVGNGASLSGRVAGVLADRFGYSATFGGDFRRASTCGSYSDQASVLVAGKVADEGGLTLAQCPT
jgi:hypothetical protein